MRTNCEFDGCPCCGTGWVEQKQNTIFHQCLEHKNKTHVSLNAVAKCKYCKLKRSWQIATGQLAEKEEDEGTNPITTTITYENLSIRIRTVSTRPTVSGTWHTVKTVGGTLEIHTDGDRSIVIDNQYCIEMCRITCIIQQDVLTIALQQDCTNDVVVVVGEVENRPIECIAIQFPSKHTAIEAHNLISSYISATTTTIAAAITLPQANLLQIMLDPTIDALVQQAELILATNDPALLPAFTQTLEFDRLCSKVDDILARTATLL